MSQGKPIYLQNLTYSILNHISTFFWDGKPALVIIGFESSIFGNKTVFELNSSSLTHNGRLRCIDKELRQNVNKYRLKNQTIPWVNVDQNFLTLCEWKLKAKRQVYNGHWLFELIAAILSVYQHFLVKKSCGQKNIWVKNLVTKQ